MNVCSGTGSHAHESLRSAYKWQGENQIHMLADDEKIPISLKHLRDFQVTDSLTFSLEMLIGDLNKIIMQTCLPLYPPFFNKLLFAFLIFMPTSQLKPF